MKELRCRSVLGKAEVNMRDCVGVGPVGLNLPLWGCAGDRLAEGLKSKLEGAGFGWWRGRNQQEFQDFYSLAILQIGKVMIPLTEIVKTRR